MKTLFIGILLIISNLSWSQQLDLTIQIDSLLKTKTFKPFNGSVLINQGKKQIYSTGNGFSDLDKKTPLKQESQFVIGSISKQITAVLILQEYDKGTLELDVPIKKYLPELTQKWANKVTIRHLLTHMHGIEKRDEPLKFKPGTKFEYSQIGFDILSSILESLTHKSFAELSLDLFQKCNMTNTFHPDSKKHHNLVFGYTENEKGELKIERNSLNNYVAAGGFISTISDLHQWNELLYEGKLLSIATFKMLTTIQKGAIRNHPLFGKTTYGLGLTVDYKDGLLQYGQTGFAPGFVSLNFYYPKTNTSLIILENVVYDANDLNKAFYYHIKILDLVRNFINSKNEH